jgi:hypothetical protein
MDRYNATLIVALTYFLTALAVYLIGQTTGAMLILVFVAGIIMNTAQTSLPAIAAAFYRRAGGPPASRGCSAWGALAESPGPSSWRSSPGVNWPSQTSFSWSPRPRCLPPPLLVVKHFVHPHVKEPSVARDLAAH